MAANIPTVFRSAPLLLAPLGGSTDASSSSAETLAERLRAEQAQALEPLVILAEYREPSSASGKALPRVGPNEIQAGCTMTPVRDRANRLNFRLTWNEREGAAFPVGPGFAAQVRPQEKEALVNGRRVDLPVAPYLRRGRLMLPLRFLADLLKARVDWTGATHIAYVILPAPSPPGTG